MFSQIAKPGTITGYVICMYTFDNVEVSCIFQKQHVKLKVIYLKLIISQFVQLDVNTLSNFSGQV